jgi:hypothetical protein
MKLKEKKTTKAIKKIINPYNAEFLASWIKTLNFQIWNKQHDRHICFRSQYVREASNIHIIYENGDTYNGNLAKGKKNGFGIFNDIINGFIYNGNWVDDQVTLVTNLAMW